MTNLIRLDAFMAQWADAYYTQSMPLGLEGDFITAPDISQLFGETIAIWLRHTWGTRYANPQPLCLLELGPGRGTLMADLWRCLPPAWQAEIEIHFVEINPPLKAAQQASMAALSPSPRCFWHEDLPALLPHPVWVVANEFFDVWPVRWRRAAPQGVEEAFIQRNPPRDIVFLPADDDSDLNPPGVGECSPAGVAYYARLCELIRTTSGGGVIIDYGDVVPSLQSTVQILHQHRRCRIQDQPFGVGDITAHVDFGALASLALDQGLCVQGPVSQKDFLSTYGIQARLERLMHHAVSLKEKQTLAEGYHRLTSPSSMGTLFKVLTLASPEGPRTLFPETLA